MATMQTSVGPYMDWGKSMGDLGSKLTDLGVAGDEYLGMKKKEQQWQGMMGDLSGTIEKTRTELQAALTDPKAIGLVNQELDAISKKAKMAQMGDDTKALAEAQDEFTTKLLEFEKSMQFYKQNEASLKGKMYMPVFGAKSDSYIKSAEPIVATAQQQKEVGDFKQYATTPGEAGTPPSSEDIRTRMTDLSPDAAKRVQPIVDVAMEQEGRQRALTQGAATTGQQYQSTAGPAALGATPGYPLEEPVKEKLEYMLESPMEWEKETAEIRKKYQSLESGDKPLTTAQLETSYNSLVDDQVALMGKKSQNTTMIKALEKALNDVSSPKAIISEKSREALMDAGYTGSTSRESLVELLKSEKKKTASLTEREDLLKREEKLMKENERLGRRAAAKQVSTDVQVEDATQKLSAFNQRNPTHASNPAVQRDALVEMGFDSGVAQQAVSGGGGRGASTTTASATQGGTPAAWVAAYQNTGYVEKATEMITAKGQEVTDEAIAKYLQWWKKNGEI